MSNKYLSKPSLFIFIFILNLLATLTPQKSLAIEIKERQKNTKIRQEKVNSILKQLREFKSNKNAPEKIIYLSNRFSEILVKSISRIWLIETMIDMIQNYNELKICGINRLTVSEEQEKSVYKSYTQINTTNINFLEYFENIIKSQEEALQSDIELVKLHIATTDNILLKILEPLAPIIFKLSITEVILQKRQNETIEKKLKELYKNYDYFNSKNEDYSEFKEKLSEKLIEHKAKLEKLKKAGSFNELVENLAQSTTSKESLYTFYNAFSKYTKTLKGNTQKKTLSILNLVKSQENINKKSSTSKTKSKSKNSTKNKNYKKNHTKNDYPENEIEEEEEQKQEDYCENNFEIEEQSEESLEEFSENINSPEITISKDKFFIIIKDQTRKAQIKICKLDQYISSQTGYCFVNLNEKERAECYHVRVKLYKENDYNHTFPKEVDHFLKDYGYETIREENSKENVQLNLVGYIDFYDENFKEIIESQKVIFEYTIDPETYICYHRCYRKFNPSNITSLNFKKEIGIFDATYEAKN